MDKPKPPLPRHDYLLLSEAADCLRCSQKTVLRLVQSGDLDGFRLKAGSSRWLVTRESFVRFIGGRMAASINS